MIRALVRLFVVGVAVGMLACTQGGRSLSVGDTGTAAASTDDAAADATGTGAIDDGGAGGDDAATGTGGVGGGEAGADSGSGGIGGGEAGTDDGSGGAPPPGQPGEPCAAGTDCASSFCVDGVCCDVACGGACRSCKLPGKAGTCSALPAGAADLRGICVDQGATTCGTDGRCDGAGACLSYRLGTWCSAATCVGDQFTTEGTSSGHGACVTTVMSCAPFGCRTDVPRCHSNCPGGDAICMPGAYCSGDEVCTPQKPGGTPCASDHECRSNVCTPAGDGGVSTCASPT